MICPACSAPTPEGARFCPSCGHNLDARVEERRVVTVLFADLVGFTALSETRDPEHVKNLVDRCFERLVDDVVSYGGRVDKILGDAIVALFGAPVAHEDDAERAVRAALRMQETLKAEAADVEGIPVAMRIGINTGEVLVGALRAGGDYTAMGDVVNVASRLQDAAQPGQVLVGPATYDATDEVVEYRALGTVPTRGRGQAVEAWEALAATAPPGYRPRRPRTALVGRDEELGVLERTFATAARRRRAALVLLTGEPGIGKSRLAEELAGRVTEHHGGAVLEGRAVPYGEANVWWPLAAAIRQACSIDAVESRHGIDEKCRLSAASVTGLEADSPDVTRLVEGLLYLLGQPGYLADVDPTRAREEALRSVQVLLEHVTDLHPVLLVISELHWADQLVLEFLDRLIDGLRNAPFVVVATARPELADRWRPDPWRHNVVALHLDPLSSEESADLLRALVTVEPEPTLTATLLERSGGNPLYLEELAALVEETGEVHHVPVSLRSLVATRLDGLPNEERRVLEDAAIIGRVGSLDGLAALASLPRDTTTAAVGALVARDLLSTDGGEWSFRSELVREVAYETLTKAERARRHAAHAEWLAAQADLDGTRGEHLEPVAHHFATAAELVLDLGYVEGVPPSLVTRALEWMELAVGTTEKAENHRLAAELLQRAIRLLPRGERRRRRELLVRRAAARAALRQLTAAHADVDEVLTESEAEGDKSTTAAGLTVLGDIQQKEGALTESAATLERAVGLWRELGEEQGVARALRLRGMTNLFLGQLDRADAEIADALTLFRELDDRRGEAWALQNLAWIAMIRGDLDHADARIAESMRAFQDAGDWGGWGWAVGLLAWVRYFQGRLEDAERLARAMASETGSHGDQWAYGMVTVLRANIQLWNGRIAEAVDEARKARDLFIEIGDTGGELRAMMPLTRGLAAAGRVSDALRSLEEAESLAPKVAEPGLRVVGPTLTAATAIHLGNGARARAALERVPGERPQSPYSTSAEELSMLGLAVLQTGDVDRALTLLEQALEKAEAPGQRAFAASALSLARAAAGQHDQAHAAADLVASSGGTYLDRLFAAWGRGFATLPDREAAADVLSRAINAVDATGDAVMQAVARLALARALESSGDERAASTLRDAGTRLRSVGVDAAGWDRVFRAAALPASRTGEGTRT